MQIKQIQQSFTLRENWGNTQFLGRAPYFQNFQTTFPNLFLPGPSPIYFWDSVCEIAFLFAVHQMWDALYFIVYGSLSFILSAVLYFKV